MKTLALALTVSLALSFGFTSRGAAQTVTFQISNQQAEALGQVAIVTDSGEYYANVNGNQTDSVQTAGTDQHVVINSQNIPEGQNAIVTLADGKLVKVQWTSNNSIDVIDESIPE